MSKAYSNKALPAGTVIREWQLEDVLGVGGFGIVYKGRGIYFGELVAIKEYFPSSISERDAEDTVVPIDSDAEEVHALGLKKFVEEAKLLWNLSTPTRHPNIVSVRSLFEIHGTAYMVMDFEDGISLSKLLKQGRRFNERSLWNIIRPVAEGLDRAHRVGVLHRDIKPPNILITENERPVLIDFGSARFEAAEATSTKVTFHTPPYAAVEQYVKTYEQGPWTDIYALGVVLYECVTGEKPPEVLERLHGSMGTALADGKWPGFSKRFLQAIDEAMTIRPTERPQTIPDWLASFGKMDKDAPAGADDEATRFFAHEVAAGEIVPVAPPAPGFDDKEHPETKVPTDPSEAKFKRAGMETGASKKEKAAAVTADAAKSEEPAKAAETEVPPAPVAAEKPAPAPRKPSAAAGDGGQGLFQKLKEKPRTALLVGGGAAALLGAVLLGTVLTRGGDSPESIAIDSEAIPQFEPLPPGNAGVVGLASAVRLLANDARSAGAPASAVDGLVTASEQLDERSAGLQALLDDPAQASAATARTNEIKQITTTANAAFAAALLRDAESKGRRLAADFPMANSGDQRAVQLRGALAALRASAEGAAKVTDAGQSLGAARDALVKSQAFMSSYYSLNRLAANAKVEKTTKVAAPGTLTGPVIGNEVTVIRTPVTAAPVASSTVGVSPAKMQQFNGTIESARAMAKQVIRMGDRGAGSAETYDKRKANAQLARNYEKYLANLKDSMRGAKNDRDADRLIGQANQTKAYISFLVKQSSK